MTPKQLNPTEAKTQTLNLLEKTPFVTFGTSGQDGWPDVRVLLVAAKDGVDTVWFATGIDSAKIGELKATPKAVIYGYDAEQMAEFRLFGTVSLLTDAAARRKIWQDDFIRHFPGGIDSPDMIVLRFDTDHGLYDRYGTEIGKF